MEDTEGLLKPQALDLEGNIEESVEHILENIRLTRDEVDNLYILFEDLMITLNEYWPGCDVIPFGSIVTGLGIKSSDVDCYVSIPKHLRKESDKKCVRRCRSFFHRRPVFQKIFYIANAKVPIVKFFHVPTQRNCDINFTSSNGVRNSKLIAFLMQSHPNILKLTLIIKYWSKVHELTGTFLVPNYALTMLVIFYLQHLNILPPIYVLQQNVRPFFVDGWNTAFSELFHPILHFDTSMHDLIGGFFEFYSTFHFKTNVISPYLGEYLERKQFQNVSNLPPQLSFYKKMLTEDCKPLKIDSSIVVQDPFQHNRNCAVAVYPRLAEKLITFFQFAAKMYREKPSSEYLKSILLHAPRVEINKKQTKSPFKNKVLKQQKHFDNLKRLENNVKRTFNIHYGKIYRN